MESQKTKYENLLKLVEDEKAKEKKRADIAEQISSKLEILTDEQKKKHT